MISDYNNDRCHIPLLSLLTQYLDICHRDDSLVMLYFNPYNAEATFVPSIRTPGCIKNLDPVILVYIG